MISKCRGQHNRLGFAYQLMFVKVFNRFSNQILLEIQPQIITFATLQLGIKAEFKMIIRSANRPYQNINSKSETI